MQNQKVHIVNTNTTTKLAYRVFYDKYQCFYTMMDWIKANCVGKVVFGQGFDNFIDFDSAKDARLFALNWGLELYLKKLIKSDHLRYNKVLEPENESTFCSDR